MMAALVAVSYTHLDVYKRQPLPATERMQAEIDELNARKAILKAELQKAQRKEQDYAAKMCIRDRCYMVFGHIHGNTDADYWPLIQANERMLNAGVDVNRFEPVTFEEIDVYKRQALQS